MKRFLSMLLAMAMLISILPAVSADGAAEPEYSGATVIYTAAGLASNTHLGSIDYNMTNGFWQYYSASSALNANFKITSSRIAMTVKVNNWVALEIYVPKAGKYDVKLSYGQMKNTTQSTNNGSIWILPLINSETGKEYVKDEITSALLNNASLNSKPIDYYSEGSSNVNVEDDLMGTYAFPSAGKYLVVFKAMEKSPKNATNAFMYPKEITLDGDGDDYNPIPMMLSSSLEKNVLPLGSTMQMQIGTIYMSDGSVMNKKYDLSYVSDNEDVATVSETGLITAVSYGNATITATATFDDGSPALTSSQNIRVDKPGAKVLYDIGSFSASVGNSPVNEPVRQAVYKNTNEFYKYYDGNFDKDNATDSYVTAKGDASANTGNLQLASNVATVYEVYIPEPGTYTMEMYNGVKSGASDVRVYLGTAEALEENGGVYKSTDPEKNAEIEASLGTYIGSYSCHKEGASGEFTSLASAPNKITGFEIPEAGYYTIAFWAKDGAGSVGDFRLACGTEDIVPMSSVVSVSKTNKAELSVMLSDKSYMDISGAKIIWTSSDPSVLKIGTSDGYVEFCGIGETEISAEIYFDEKLYYTAKYKYELTELPEPVPLSGVVYKYNFFQTISPDWAPFSNPGQSESPGITQDTDVLGIKYDYTDGTWEWFGAGPNNYTPIAYYHPSYLRIYQGPNRWAGLTIKVPTAGRYAVDFEYYARTKATGTTDIYLIPKPSSNPVDLDNLLIEKYYLDTVNHYSASGDITRTRALGTVDIEEPGEYVLAFFLQPEAPHHFYIRILTLDGMNTMRRIRFNTESYVVDFGERVATSISPTLLDGTVLDEGEYTVWYETSDPNLATVDKNGVITGRGDGEVTITATVLSGENKISESVVITARDDTEIAEKKIKCDDIIYVGGKTKLSFAVVLESGNEMVIPAEKVIYTCDANDVLSFDEPGYLTALTKEESVTLTASATFRGEEVSAEKTVEVVRDTGKTASTYYTDKKRANALENVSKYSWAKKLKDTAVKEADKYLGELDYLYDMIFAEGLPRSTRMGGLNDPYYNLCRYCNGGINKKGSEFLVNILTRPWQTQCPECKRLFPSNDFGSFMKLGLDREGRFDRIRALEAHREMLLEMGKDLPDAGITDERKREINEGDFLTRAEQEHYGFGVDGGYLVNEMYKELADPSKIPESFNNEQGLREGEDWKTWGVDDGWGYVPLQPDGVTPYKYSVTGSGGSVSYYDEKHVYVAYIVDATMGSGIRNVLSTLKDAYLYTGDIKYGRAGAILIDRMADVYHTYDMFVHYDRDIDGDGKYDRVWYNTEGGSGTGIIQGNFAANYHAEELALCADAFFPALNDSRVIDYLSEKAKKYGYDTLPDDDKYNYHENYTSTGTVHICDGDCREYEHEMRRNDKSSSHDIWKNWENGIIRKNYWGIKYGRITGNFGQSQATAAINAIVQDRQPETNEMFEWIYRYPSPSGTFEKGGGGVTNQTVDVVDRDGMGHEASTNYNRTQIEGLGKMADYLAEYKDAGKYDLYGNPIFREMFMAFTRPVTPPGHPNIADASTTLSRDYYSGDFEIWKNGFRNLRDTDIADELAQYIWTRNGRTTEGLHYDIFTKDPESFETDVTALVDETGAMESDLMAGWGFAILRDGGIYDSASASMEVNNMRDFWISAGVTSGHGHADALELNVDAFGLNLGADLGYPEDVGSTPNRMQWVSATMSHNTVMVNRENSSRDVKRGFPLHFNDSGMVKLMDIDASHKYAQTENYRRSLVMVKINDETSYGVDFFRVTGGNHHTYIYHSASSKVNEVSGLSMATEPELIQVDKNGTMDYATYAGKDAAYVKNSDGSVRKALPGEEVDFETVFPVTYGQDPWTSGSSTMFTRGATWLRNVRRAAEPTENFTVDFEITDYKNVLSNSKGIHLRMTQINNFVPSGVAFAGGHVPQLNKSSKGIGYKDQFNSDRATMLEYVYIEREAGEGQELDSLFTTVYEPYRNTSNIESIVPVDVSVVSGTEKSGDMVRAVKVTHVGGERIDYVVYATNNSVTYNVGGMFDFRGFVGVLSTNKDGKTTYRYVHDGDIIGGEVESKGTITGNVEGFEKELALSNYIDISVEAADTSGLAGEYIFIDNDGEENAVYKIKDAKVLEDHNYGDDLNIIRLDIDRTRLIRQHIDTKNPEIGYVYNIAEGQIGTIPLSYSEDYSPEFAPVNDSITTSAGSTISVSLSATSPVEENAPKITYIGTTLPRGASINAETGVFTWKPDSSQIGENHVAITARDSEGRETTIHFNVMVYGSTTGGSSNKNDTETPSENTGTSGDTSTPAGGGG
ncbi:MAG: Ig-like domain-containing protein, partial [Oscillospiraceae bacterium]|nr:Ig-like domain-containing protein [Oscillospiraceae bacterium]